MNAYIVVTPNTQDVRDFMNTFDAMEQAGETETIICWHWINVSPSDLNQVIMSPRVIGVIQLS